jgi:hypothetical protein
MPPPASTIISLDPDEFLAAAEYAEMVAENELLEEIPGFIKSRITMPDGRYAFKKDPFILFGFAAQRYFRNDRDKFVAFFTRYFALRDLLEHDQMKPFRKPGDEVELHRAAIEVAAIEKLSDGYKFDPESFFPRVRDAATHLDGETRQVNETE